MDTAATETKDAESWHARKRANSWVSRDTAVLQVIVSWKTDEGALCNLNSSCGEKERSCEGERRVSSELDSLQDAGRVRKKC